LFIKRQSIAQVTHADLQTDRQLDWQTETKRFILRCTRCFSLAKNLSLWRI